MPACQLAASAGRELAGVKLAGVKLAGVKLAGVKLAGVKVSRGKVSRGKVSRGLAEVATHYSHLSATVTRRYQDIEVHFRVEGQETDFHHIIWHQAITPT